MPGKYEEALLFTSGRWQYVKKHWVQSPGVAMCLNNMAGLYRDQGNMKRRFPLTPDIDDM